MKFLLGASHFATMMALSFSRQNNITRLVNSVLVSIIEEIGPGILHPRIWFKKLFFDIEPDRFLYTGLFPPQSRVKN